MYTIIKLSNKSQEERNMKKIATTQLYNADEEIFFNEYEDGSMEKVINEQGRESSMEELQELISSGNYQVHEMTW